MGFLYIVATPIGHLKDITLRALEVLKEVDLILAEDTRVTKKLLNYYQIKKPLERYQDFLSQKKWEKIKKELKKGKKIALVSDAGTPNIADPGFKLVSLVQKELKEVKVIPIPGASALIAALSVSGIKANQFTFLGYPPHKKRRKEFFEKIKNIEIRPLVIYEAPHRLQKTLKELSEIFGESYGVIIGHELTKFHEEIKKENLKEMINYFQGEKLKGEFVIIIP